MKKNILEDEKIKNNRLSKHLVKGYSAPKKTLHNDVDDEHNRPDDEW